MDGWKERKTEHLGNLQTTHSFVQRDTTRYSVRHTDHETLLQTPTQRKWTENSKEERTEVKNS